MPRPQKMPPMAFVTPALALLLSACAPATPPAVTVRTDVSCKVFRKISWSILDTVQTVDEVRRHNARYLSVCRRRSSYK